MMKKGLFFILLILFFAASLFAVGEIEHGGDVLFTGDEAKLFFYNGIYYNSFRASGSLAGNYNFIWPINDGASGQTLITDGSGALSFADVNAVAGIHTVLSITHQDSTTSAITAGDIVFSNATPKWDDLAIGASNEVLRVSGGLPDWQATTFITETGALTYVDGTLALASGSITDTGGTIDFGNEILVTTGTLGAGTITSTGNLSAGAITGTSFTTTGTGKFENITIGLSAGGQRLYLYAYNPDLMTGDRILEFNVNDADRILSLSGNLTVEATSIINSDLSTDANWETSGSITGGSLITGGNITATGYIQATSYIKTNSNIRLKDPLAAFYLFIATNAGSISADRNLNFDVGDATRTLTFSGNPTLADWFDQSVKQAASPTFASGVTIGNLTLADGSITDSGGTISFGNENLTTTGIITGKHIIISDPTPILVFKDSIYAGDASLGFMEWRDSNNTRLGFFGNSSSGNDDLLWKNESSGGHIGIQTTGGGEVQISANLTISGTNEINFRDTDISMGSTLTDGILDISADGSIRMFYDNADVGDAVAGQALYIYRRAAEADDYIKLWVDESKQPSIDGTGEWFFYVNGVWRIAVSPTRLNVRNALTVGEDINTSGVYKVDTVQVVGNQQAHIADAPGDTAANNATTINEILTALEAHGLLAGS